MSFLLTDQSPPKLKHNNLGQDFSVGIGWYPDDDNAVNIVKGGQFINDVTEFPRFYSSTFMGYSLSWSKSQLTQDAQPFSRSYAGKDWLFIHDGVLQEAHQQKLALLKSAFEPMGINASEHAMCWLLNQLQHYKARSLVDVDCSVLYNWCQQLNTLGQANIIFSSKDVIVIYQDKNNFNPIYYQKFYPPNNKSTIENKSFSLEIGLAEDSLKSYLIFSQFSGQEVGGWNKLLPGQLLIISQGAIIWNSLKQNSLKEKSIYIEPFNVVNTKQPLNNILTEQPLSEHVNKITAPYIFTGLNNIKAQRKLMVTHNTSYCYSDAVQLSKHLFRLQPVFDHEQLLLDYQLTLSCNEEHQVFDDVFGNSSRYIEITKPYTKLDIQMEATVSLPKEFNDRRSIIRRQSIIPLPWMPWQRQMLAPYLMPTELPESQLSELMDYAMSFVERNNHDVMSVLDDINQTIFSEYQYASGSTSFSTTAFDVYVNRHGVCQDFSNLFICLARLLGVPARYRAGYLYTGEHYTNAQQGDATHAWLEVYLPWLGWYGYDPTNGCRASSDHIRVACGRNYHDATPTTGTIYQGGGAESLTINVKVHDIT